MTKPATLPELLAQGLVKPGGEAKEAMLPYVSLGQEILDILKSSGVRVDADPKPPKTPKWGDWEDTTGEAKLIDHMQGVSGIQVKWTLGGLKIRERLR